LRFFKRAVFDFLALPRNPRLQEIVHNEGSFFLGKTFVKLAKITIAALLVLASPLHAQTPNATLVQGTDQACRAKLADGTSYDFHRRILRGQWKGQEVFADVRAYYRPGTGEFLFFSDLYSKAGFERDLKDRPALPCGSGPDFHVTLLDSGEWADFWASNASPRITVFHSTLRFPSIAEAWRYASTHLDECQVGTASSKCQEEIPLYKELGGDFFRPERLRFDARPYMYNPLVSAKKVGATWQVEIKGADEPNRALVTLDEHFKLLTVTRFSAPK
jgi:hypothetical protein